MSAVISLTERERAEIRKKLLAEKMQDWLFVTEALTEAEPQTAKAIIASFQNDGWGFRHYCQQAVHEYLLRNEKYTEAEEKVLSSKSVNGKRYLEA